MFNEGSKSMTKRSTMLKVVSILMIIFGVIETFIATALAFSVWVILAAADLAVAEVSEILAEYGYYFTGPIMAALVVCVIGCIFEFVAGILGLTLKDKKTIFIIGCVLLILTFVSLILSFVTESFSWTSIVGFVLPILYMIGARNCVQGDEQESTPEA